jgi:hypothetical protein
MCRASVQSNLHGLTEQSRLPYDRSARRAKEKANSRSIIAGLMEKVRRCACGGE